MSDEPVAATSASIPPAVPAAASEPPVAPVPDPATPPAVPAAESAPQATEPSAPVEAQPPTDPQPAATDVPPAPETAPVDPQQPATEPAASETPAGTDGVPSAAEEPVQVAPPVPAAVIDGIVYRGRSDDDVLHGSFCRVIDGEHAGRYGVLVATATVFLDGWPATVTVRTRDDRDELIVVNYADIRPAQAGGR